MLRSTAIAINGHDRRRNAAQSSRGTCVNAVWRWPCSQRVRCESKARSDSGIALLTPASGQNSGRWPRSARSIPNCMSSTRLPPAGSASLTNGQGIAMPVPVIRQGAPNRISPNGRTRLVTRFPKIDTASIGPFAGRWSVRFLACTGRRSRQARSATMAIAPGSGRQSASITTTTSGGSSARWRKPRCSAYPFPRRRGSFRSTTSVPARRASSAVRSVQLSATTRTRSAAESVEMIACKVCSMTSCSS